MADGDHIPCSHCGKQYNSVEDDKAEDELAKVLFMFQLDA